MMGSYLQDVYNDEQFFRKFKFIKQEKMILGLFDIKPYI